MNRSTQKPIAGINSEVQRLILGFISTQEIVTIEELAKALKLKIHTVRYNLNQLLEQGNIKRVVRISSDRLGVTVYNFFFNLPKRRANAALEFLSKHRMVQWLAENSWERKYEMTIFTRSKDDLITIFEELGDACDTHIHDCLMCMESDVTYFGMKSLVPANTPVFKRKYNELSEPIKLDQLDYKLLQHYMLQPEVGIGGTAKKLGVSHSTCAYRLQKLKESKVISWEGYHSFNRREPLAEAQLLLQARSLSNEVRAHIEEIASSHPYVEILLRCQGDWDYKLLMYGEDLQSLLDSEESVCAQLGKSIRSSRLVIRRRKLIHPKLPDIFGK